MLKVVTMMTGNGLTAKILREKGLPAIADNYGKVVVDLPVDSIIRDRNFYKIPQEVCCNLNAHNDDFRIQIASFTLKGEYAMVPCNHVSGEMLKPFFTPKKAPDSIGYKENGLFCSRGKEVITVLVRRTSKGDVIVITKLVVTVINNSFCFVAERRLWMGKVAELTAKQKDFLPAINVALERINEGKTDSSNKGRHYEV